jgi:two-component system, NarL family, invasion response regulator UvrY
VPLRVVICDDVAELRALVRAQLEADGDISVVGEAGSGIEAIGVIEEERPELVLLDLSMPDMDGLEVLAKLREAAPETRVVVFSGFVAGPLGRRAVALGAYDYVEKGAPADELRRAVRAAAGLD